MFVGLETSPALQKVFGSRTEMSKILGHLKLRVEATDSGLWLDRAKGTICIGYKLLSTAKVDFLYLDVVHVLVHVRQFLEGRELYDQAFEYVERPTELEAYRCTVTEARRVGLTEDEILRYLRMDAVDDSDGALELAIVAAVTDLLLVERHDTGNRIVLSKRLSSADAT